MGRRAYFLINVGIDGSKGSYPENPVKQLKEMAEVVEVKSVFGLYDLLVEVEAPGKVTQVVNKVMANQWVERLHVLRTEQEIKCPYFEEEVDGAYYCRAGHVKKRLTASDMQSFAPCSNERYRHCSLYQDWIYWKSRETTDVAHETTEQRESVPAKM